jgi:hypothetical protein
VDSKLIRPPSRNSWRHIQEELILWIGTHTHTDPDDTYGGKSHIEKRWGGTTFINVAAIHPFSNTVFREAGC